MLADHFETLLQRFHVRVAGLKIAQALLEVIALDVDDGDVCQSESFLRVGGHQRPLLLDAPGDHRSHLWVF